MQAGLYLSEDGMLLLNDIQKIVDGRVNYI